MKKNILLFFCLLVSAFNSFGQLQNTGWRRPGLTHFPNDWTNPQNAFGSDDLYTEVLHQSGCRCPFMDLSWDDGINFSTSNIFGPYGTTDSDRINGDSTDNWGHSWSDAELSDSVFLLRIWNSSTLLKQGYSNFGFNIPTGSSINGIEIRVEARGDSSYIMDYVDNIEVMVYYYLPTAVNEIYSATTVVTVFPNPAENLLHFRFNRDTEPQKIQMMNIQGELISEKYY
ncbi:MAG: hypothetical protein ABI763_05180, partial [Bacteroidota bacterium]